MAEKLTSVEQTAGGRNDMSENNYDENRNMSGDKNEGRNNDAVNRNTEAGNINRDSNVGDASQDKNASNSRIDTEAGSGKGRFTAMLGMLTFVAIFIAIVLFGFLVLKCTN